MTRLTDCYCDVFSYVLALLPAKDTTVGYDTIRQDILGLLETADARAAAAGFDPEAGADARFAVCAWVDETILRSGWEGAKIWQTNQLQQRYYATHNAGVEFFNRLDALGDTDSPARETYALCLGLGFSGEFFPEDRLEALGEIRRQAIRKAAGRPLSDFAETDEHLFPQAYQTQTHRGKRFNPWAFDWWFFLIPVLSAVIAAGLYILLRNDLNIQLLGFFGALS
jgi:type VI secretion system protein ImpK